MRLLARSLLAGVLGESMGFVEVGSLTARPSVHRRGGCKANVWLASLRPGEADACASPARCASPRTTRSTSSIRWMIRRCRASSTTSRTDAAPSDAKRLADAIKAIDADIIALEEVESLEALTWFRDKYLPDAGYKHLASKDVGYYRGVECSVMSRFPITETQGLAQRIARQRQARRRRAGRRCPPDDKHLTFQRSPLMVDDQGQRRLRADGLRHASQGRRDFDCHREAEAFAWWRSLDEMRATDPSPQHRGDGRLQLPPRGTSQCASISRRA